MTFWLYLIATLLVVTSGVFSFYFHGVYRHWFEPDRKWIPEICRMDEGHCTTIVDTRYGRLVFGIPNALLGIFVLPVISGVVIGAWMGLLTIWLPWILVGGLVTAGIYLIYGLKRLQTSCPVCLTVHTLNLAAFMFLTMIVTRQ